LYSEAVRISSFNYFKKNLLNEIATSHKTLLAMTVLDSFFIPIWHNRSGLEVYPVLVLRQKLSKFFILKETGAVIFLPKGEQLLLKKLILMFHLKQ